jgi:ABC-2 type transport system permease protein
LPNELPIGIVDKDNSSFSRMVRRNLDAEQGVQVLKTYSEYQAARKALQVGDIYGFIDIPNGAYRDILEGRRPKIGIYCEQGLMVPGNFTYKNFIYIGTVLDVGVRREILKAKGYPESGMMARLQPIRTDFHLIKNPWTNYGIYLTTILWPGLLQLCILLMTVFSIGYELKMKTSRDWMIGKPWFNIQCTNGQSCCLTHSYMC